MIENCQRDMLRLEDLRIKLQKSTTRLREEVERLKYDMDTPQSKRKTGIETFGKQVKTNSKGLSMQINLSSVLYTVYKIWNKKS